MSRIKGWKKIDKNNKNSETWRSITPKGREQYATNIILSYPNTPFNDTNKYQISGTTGIQGRFMYNLRRNFTNYREAKDFIVKWMRNHSKGGIK